VKKNKRNKLGFTICQPPVSDTELKNENLSMKDQIQIRKDKLKLDIKPLLPDILERKI